MVDYITVLPNDDSALFKRTEIADGMLGKPRTHPSLPPSEQKAETFHQARFASSFCFNKDLLKEAGEGVLFHTHFLAAIPPLYLRNFFFFKRKNLHFPIM